MCGKRAADDDALLFFREVVEPTVAEFMADRADKRRGCLACLAIAAMTEHYFHSLPDLATSGLPAFKVSIRNDNAAVGMIADVANATKHVKRRGDPGRMGYDDVQPLEMGQFGIARMGWPMRGEEVIIGTNREWRLSTLIECAMDFWQRRLGIADTELS